MTPAMEAPLGSLTDQIANRADDAVDKAAAQVGSGLRRATATAHTAVDRIATAVEPAAAWADQRGKALAATSMDFSETCSTQIRARPIASVLGAVAVGYFLGRVMR